MKRATIVLVVFLLGGVVSAEDPTPGKREKALSDEYRAFEQKLEEAFNAWRRIDPQKADRLERAFQASRQAFETKEGGPEAIWERMRSITGLLDLGAGQSALVAEKEILDALERVLASLQDEGEKKVEHASLDMERLRDQAERILRLQREHMDRLPDAKADDLKKIEQATRELGKAIEKAHAPGKRHVDRAIDEQERAGDDLANRHADTAREEEKEAARELEELVDALREALIQARLREQHAVLASLGQRFARMLEKQQDLSRRTEALAATRTEKEEPSRKQKLECAALSAGERELKDDADTAAALVREEGHSVNLPSILGDLGDDLGRLSELLAKKDTGHFVRTVQKDTEKTLEELIEAIKKEVQEVQARGDNPRDGSPDDPNGEKLLPATAELKLIRAQQIRVNSQTREADQAPDRTEPCRMVAAKQARVVEMVRALEASLNR